MSRSTPICVTHRESTGHLTPVLLALCAAILTAIPIDAQTRAPFRASRRIYAGLFAGDPRARVRVRAAPLPRSAARERAANALCAGCEDRPGASHFVIDSPLLTDEWLANHHYQANGTTFGDNAVVADFWYDAVHRRLVSRSAVFREVADPADVRLGRAPGTYPNAPDFTALLEPGTTVGQIGFDTWSRNGYGAYFAAVQGAVRDTTTGYLDLSTATGRSGRTRGGSSYGPEDLVKHVRLHPTGELEVGYETAADAVPEALLTVRGNANVEGTVRAAALRLESVGGNVPHACTLRSASAPTRQVTAACVAPALAISGGGSCSRGTLQASHPVQSGEVPDAWQINCGADGLHTAFVICCAQ